MPVSLPADANGFDVPGVKNCLLKFSLKVLYNSHSLRIYMFSNNVDHENNTRNYRKTF